MTFQRYLRGAVGFLLTLGLFRTPARALIALNDGHDRIYVTGTAAFGWDSNLFANRDAQGDRSVSTTLVAEYTRRAGLIGVNGTLELDSTRYGNFTSENFNNPKLAVELTKQTGRTTGSLTLDAARESQADAAVNVRSTSWNYDAGLNFRYPIISIYTLSGQLGYSLVKYVDGVFPTLATYTADTNLIRLFSSERDVMLGYRFRRSETSLNGVYDDHNVSVGMSGKLIRGINGTLHAGYEVRVPHGFAVDGRPERSFGSWTASGSGTYALTHKANITGTLAKDFATTAVDTSVDTTTASLAFTYAYTSRWAFTNTASVGDNRFVGDAGRIVRSRDPLVLGPGRHDQFVSDSVSLSYTRSEHFKVSATYTWFKNWSNFGYAAFARSAYTVDLSSRW